MGLGSYLKHVASWLVWALGAAQVMLLVFVHGPTHLSKMSCQLAYMGPGSCPSSAAILLVWTHAAKLNILPADLYGPIKVPEESCRYF